MKLSELLSKPLKLKGRNTGVLDLRGFAKQVVDMEKEMDLDFQNMMKKDGFI